MFPYVRLCARLPSITGSIPPNYFCRGWNGKEGREKYCGSRAGSGTDHPGHGRCGWHGGRSAIKHGNRRRYNVRTPKLAELIARQDEDPEPLNIIDDIKLQRALLEQYIEDAEKIDGDVVLKFTSAIARDTERVFNMRAKMAITFEQLARFLAEAERRIAHRVRAAIIDPKEADTVLEKIGDDIRGIRP